MLFLKKILIDNETDKLQVGLVLLCCFLAVIAQMSATLYLPALLNIQQALSISESAVSLSLTMFVLFSAMGQLIFSGMSDVFGRRNVILTGLIIAIAASIFSSLAVGSISLIAARSLEGLGVGAITATSRAVLNDTHSKNAVVSAISISAIAAASTSMFSPLIGAVVLQIFKYWQSVFITLTIVGIILLLIAIFKLPESSNYKQHVRTKVFKSLFKNLLTVFLGDKRPLAFMLSASTAFTILFTYYVTSPFLFQSGLHLTYTEYSMIFLITSGAFITGSTSAKILSNHLRPNRIINFSSIVMIIAGALFLTLYYVGIFNIISTIIVLFIIILMVGLIFPIGMANGISYYKHLSGTATAIMGFLQMLSSAIGMFIISFLPKSNPAALSAIIIVLGLLIFLLVNTWAKTEPTQ